MVPLYQRLDGDKRFAPIVFKLPKLSLTTMSSEVEPAVLLDNTMLLVVTVV